MKRAVKYFSVLILSSLIAGTFSRVCAQTLYTGDGDPTGLEEEIRWRVNRGRFDTVSENQARGTAYTDVTSTAGPLAPNQSLTLAARHQSEDMAKHNLFQHATIPGSAYYNSVTQPNPWDRMLAEGYSWSSAAENIAAGYSGAEAAYVGWWNSTGHRENMYNPSLREIGGGMYYWSSSTYGSYYTMDLGSSGNNAFFTDTIFHDANTNGVYDSGEAVAGISVLLIAAGSSLGAYDISSSVGSFAVPLQTIPASTLVQVVLSNTTSASVSLSVPRTYHNFTTVTLGAAQKQTIGSFTQTASARNFGFRDLSAIQPPITSPAVSLSASGQDFMLTWVSQTNLQYRPQWTSNFQVWSNLTGFYQIGTGSAMSFRDTGAMARAKGFYRVVTSPR